TGLGWGDFKRIRGVVVRQHGAIAVEDQSPVWDDRNDRDPVVLSESVVVLVLEDLDVEKPSHEQKEDKQHCPGAEREAHLKVVQFALMIAQLCTPATAQDDWIALLVRGEAAEDTQPRQHRDPVSAAAEFGSR